MAHVEDLWVDDGGEHRPRHGTGKRYRVRWVDPGGHERSRSFARKTDADKFRSTTEADLERGHYMDPASGKITLRRHAEGWLAAQTFGASTRESTEQRLRLHVCPVLGDVALSQLTPSRIQAWVRGLAVAPSYAKVILTTLSTCLNAAVDDGLIPKNPCHARSVRPPKVDERKIQPWRVRGWLPSGVRSPAGSRPWRTAVQGSA
jgi:hypothetical protein